MCLGNRVPSFLFGREKWVCTELCLAYEVHEAEPGFAASPTDYAKVEPLGAAFGIHIILHVEVVCGNIFLLRGEYE